MREFFLGYDYNPDDSPNRAFRPDVPYRRFISRVDHSYPRSMADCEADVFLAR